jgi:hypothetical protein
MEDSLDLDAEPYDRPSPVVCVDKKLDQLVSEVRQALPLGPGHPLRYDDEYRREGTCHVLMCVEPLQGWRHVKVTNRRTAQDVAHWMKDLVDIHFSPRRLSSASYWTTCTRIRRPRCRLPFPRPKLAASGGSWIFTRRPRMAVGSTWRKSNSRSSRPTAWTDVWQMQRPSAARSPRGKHAAMRLRLSSNGVLPRQKHDAHANISTHL